MVVAGFEPLDILASVHMLLQQLRDGRCEVENQYSRVVPRRATRGAEADGRDFELRPHFEWRGLGFISQSALKVNADYAEFDAEEQFSMPGCGWPTRRRASAVRSSRASSSPGSARCSGPRARRRPRSGRAWCRRRAPARRTTTSGGCTVRPRDGGPDRRGMNTTDKHERARRHRLFAQYAHAPNALGYCGPADAAALRAVACGAGADVDVRRWPRFSGAWPYQEVIAELAGIDDPLDERVVRAYWTGNELTDAVGNVPVRRGTAGADRAAGRPLLGAPHRGPAGRGGAHARLPRVRRLSVVAAARRRGCRSR